MTRWYSELVKYAFWALRNQLYIHRPRIHVLGETFSTVCLGRTGWEVRIRPNHFGGLWSIEATMMPVSEAWTLGWIELLFYEQITEPRTNNCIWFWVVVTLKLFNPKLLTSVYYFGVFNDLGIHSQGITHHMIQERPERGPT